MNIDIFGMPHTSVAGDRRYSSADWRKFWGLILTNGVIGSYNNELQVKPQASPNKTVYVDTGAICINGLIRTVEDVINLSHSDNTSGSTRIDRVVARLNLQEATRKLEFAVVEGTPGAGAPALTQTDEIYELSLAQVELANGYSTITSSEITSERDDETVCGFSKTMGQSKFEKENDLLQYDRDVTTFDTNGNPTVIEYSRPSDSSLFLKRTYSNADSNGYYQTVTEEFYEEDGVTVYKTITYTLTFTSSGIIDTSSRVVTY